MHYKAMSIGYNCFFSHLFNKNILPNDFNPFLQRGIFYTRKGMPQQNRVKLLDILLKKILDNTFIDQFSEDDYELITEFKNVNDFYKLKVNDEIDLYRHFDDNDNKFDISFMKKNVHKTFFENTYDYVLYGLDNLSNLNVESHLDTICSIYDTLTKMIGTFKFLVINKSIDLDMSIDRHISLIKIPTTIEWYVDGFHISKTSIDKILYALNCNFDCINVNNQILKIDD